MIKTFLSDKYKKEKLTADVDHQGGKAQSQMQWHKGQQSALKHLIWRALIEGVKAKDVGAHDEGQRRVAVAVAEIERKMREIKIYNLKEEQELKQEIHDSTASPTGKQH